MSRSKVITYSNNDGSTAAGDKASVGFRRPPADKRFAKGRSGNPKGRPKGTPNAADILKNLFNKKISVRGKNSVRLMRTCEAIIRHAEVKARSGDVRALDTILGILDRLGATNDVTSEEREKRTLRLPRSYSEDEYDLLNSDAREKERQHYLAIAHREAHAGEAPLSPIHGGDEFVKQGKADDALAAYCRQIAICVAQLANNVNDGVAQKDLMRAVARIGLLADQLLFAGEFAITLKCADEAIAHGVEAIAHGIATNLTWIELIRAHASMFLGKADEARKFYLHFQSNKRIAVTNWEMVALQNFEQLRKAGHSHPLMVEIEQKLFAAGWTAQGRAPEKVAASSMSSDDQYFIIMNPDDIKTAALYAEHGKLDEAKNVYERILENCQARLAKEPGHAETKQTLNIIIVRLALLAQKFIRDGRFASALECSEKLIAVAPERYRAHAIHTHALMFIGRNDEAEALYLRYRGQKIGDDPWRTAILADFRQFRQAGRSNSLMDKIEALFDAND